MAVDADTARGEMISAANETSHDDKPVAEEDDTSGEDQKLAAEEPQGRNVRAALVAGMLALASVGAMTGWLGWQTFQGAQTQHLRDMFLQTGRQGAVNLTTMDFEHADADIQRVLDMSAGSFYVDFQQRSPAFSEIVKKTQSKTEGTVTDAGIESISGDSARVLVAVAVKTSNLAAPQQRPRLWRMRIDVQRIGDTAKVTNVGFVA
ncbi:MCE associated membrane protein [Mycobacteroides abscessus]|uniref:hypothetical protein n=2 Tax=Mycobacteroides abscessus TaxID=36809 RepID=UPI0005E95DD1|nr:hypothetical protein [Mycobacteroides abscessus]CPT92224.1 MCE associated membrane protein [Mycobacteroides abscessus]CPW40849.1 MCE associated membrane protein [Mycobacteroides abscessus]